ncbi:ATP-dependent DNA helicase RecQ [Actibacterium lipolyticum]|uniref:Pyocin activator protein PrtN n=1 Tax=Actibacterium lipolyticum TaxID=1524263 RepID=A0A238JV64_9RHOB|nr:ATP-dependent DNA helicase RecQ [Actibacterium lipolyticum]SMX34393.1 hypothetical protein COL8621_01287 [Actibacterium lipolyticum]
MSTSMILLAAYGAQPNLPFSAVAQDFYQTTPENLYKRLRAGKIDTLGASPERLKREGFPVSWINEMIEGRRNQAIEQMQRWSRHK